MILKLNTFYQYFISLVFILLIFNVNGNIVNFPDLITTQRLVFVTFTLVSITLILKYNINITTNRLVIILQLIFIFIFINGLLTYIISPNLSLNFTSVFLNSLFWFQIYIFSIIFFSLNFKITENFIDKFVKITIISSLIITISTWFVVIFILGLNINNYFTLRTNFNSFFQMGLNRYLTGLVFLNLFNIPIMLGLYKISFFYKAVAILTSFSFIILSLLLGSRQTLLFIIIYILLLLLLDYKNKRIVFFNEVKKIFLLSISLVIIYLTVMNSFLKYWVYQRLISTTTDQINNSDGIREMNFKIGLDYIKNNPLIGYGPNQFNLLTPTNTHAHNGFISLGVGYGSLSLLLLVFVIAAICLKVLTKNLVNNNLNNFLIILLSFTMVFFFISNLFNDLIEEFSFWILVFLIIKIIIEPDSTTYKNRFYFE